MRSSGEQVILNATSVKMILKIRRFVQTISVILLVAYTTLLAYQSFSRVSNEVNTFTWSFVFLFKHLLLLFVLIFEIRKKTTLFLEF